MRIAITLGDVAGIGPEVTARALANPRINASIHPVIYGPPAVWRRTLDELKLESLWDVPCVSCGPFDAAEVRPGANDPRAGAAAFDALLAATQACLAGEVDAIVTAPLSKAALHMAGHSYPGHTEILAEVCGVHDYAMMLYVPPGPSVRGPYGLGVVHVTLHTSIRSVPGLLSESAVLEKIRLIDGFMRDLTGAAPQIGVCALNPHAGEEGLFGDEEPDLILPAVRAARAQGLDSVYGPYPADTLMKRAVDGEFDAVVAMYHDQGHIALKLVAFGKAVNVTLGLPIIRTSPSHGTAFDIAGKRKADPAGMTAAIDVAVALARRRADRGADAPEQIQRS